MGFWNWLFGQPQTELRTANLAGTGKFAFDIVGEGSYQDVLDAICGGRCEEGHRLVVAAAILPESGNRYDPNAVQVFIKGHVVGYIARDAAKPIREDLIAIGADAGLCEARIVGGWDRGHDQGYYGVKLDIALPLRRRD